MVDPGHDEPTSSHNGRLAVFSGADAAMKAIDDYALGWRVVLKWRACFMGGWKYILASNSDNGARYVSQRRRKGREFGGAGEGGREG